MSRSRWFNLIAIVLMIVIVGVFAAIAIPGVLQNQDATGTPPNATPTPPPIGSPQIGINTEPQPIELPVQIGSITLTADQSDAEALASAVPLNAMGVFSVPTPMYGGPTYMMSLDEARGVLGTDPMLPLYIPQTHIMSQWYGYDGLISIAYTTEGYEHSLVLNEQRPTSNTQTYAVGSAPVFSTSVRGYFAIYLEQAPIGLIPPMLGGYDPAQGGWVQATSNPPSSGTIWPFNALIWEENGLLIRLMSSVLDVNELLAIAESMTPNGTVVIIPTNGTPTPTPLPTPNLNAFYVPEVPINVTLPPGYSMTRNLNETNRRGSFAAYNIESSNSGETPYLYEMQFFTYDSIKQFTESCGGGFCFEGDYPTTERYIAQYEAWTNGTELADYPIITTGQHLWFVSQFPCSGGISCIIREYTFFAGEIKIDTWVMMESEGQASLADALIQQVYFEQIIPTPAPTPTAIQLTLGVPFDVSPLQQINLLEQELYLMVTHIDDTRCLPDVECIQAGSVTINVDVSHRGEQSVATLTLPAGSEPVSMIVGAYSITLYDVITERNPSNGPPTGYTIRLMVDQALTSAEATSLLVINNTGQELCAVQIAPAGEGATDNWGANRLSSPLPNGAQLRFALIRGMYDLYAETCDGTFAERYDEELVGDVEWTLTPE